MAAPTPDPAASDIVVGDRPPISVSTGAENDQHHQQLQQQQHVDNEIVDSPRGLCGAMPEPGTCGGVDVKGKMKDLRQKVGGGLVAKLRKRSSTGLSSEASLYDPSLYICGGSDDAVLDEESRAVMEDEPIPASLLSDPSRTICVVTTAALPWRTGTSVNPLLRALYLARFQDERRKERERKERSGMSTDGEEGGNTTSNTGEGSVVLVIPWLESEEDRVKLYGEKNSFPDGPEGVKQQEEWIRTYSSERCGMPSEATRLKMIFYPAFYLAGFGSIFPKVDLCNFIPRELVDVAILEEPEHLNWFRMPGDDEGEREGKRVSRAESEISLSEHDEESGSKNKPAAPAGDAGELAQKVEVTINESSSSNDIMGMLDKPTVNDGEDDTKKGDKATDDSQNDGQNDNSDQPKKKKLVDKAKLGWTHRFNFVVGIVHTNYEAYARQYGIGASLIAAPAIGAVSALAIRAYCHQVIKLSDTLPSFAPGKELTCNVHGVRKEFLEGVDLDVLASAGKEGKDGNKSDESDAPSPVYFIGKLVWAKGFDLMLELQDIFRKRNDGEYFPIDIYGGGPDEKAIARAFHGRNHLLPMKRPPKISSKDSSSLTPTSSQPADARDLNAAVVLANPRSIKDQSSRVIEQMRRQSLTRAEGDDVVSQYLSLGFEVCQMNGSATYVKESRRELTQSDGGEENNQQTSSSAPASSRDNNNSKNANPLDILGDLSGKSFDTGVKTSQAVYNIADSSIKNILNMSFSQLKHPLKARRERKERKEKERAAKEGGEVGDGKEEEEDKPHFVFDPPVSRYEWRRHPIPARFPGVIDHAQLKNAPHKIFLNPSTSEVLCTTTAEALAMNKFVILPRHPSNDFFLQFTNCLSYDTLEECAEKMAWALERAPAALSEEERRKFTWEAATERLVESSIVTVGQARERAENGMDKTDARIAYWLSESGEKSNMIRNLFQRNVDGGSGNHSPMMAMDG